MSKVIDFPTPDRTLDVDAPEVLKQASEFITDGEVVILGITEDGDQYLLSSREDPAAILLQLEMAKHMLLSSMIEFDDDDS